MSQSKANDLKQLLKHEELVRAFDKLLPIPALWTDMQLAVLHLLVPLHCNEEIVSYLAVVEKYWFNILDGRDEFLGKLDSKTCRLL